MNDACTASACGTAAARASATTRIAMRMMISVLAACASPACTTGRYYIPADPAFASEHTACGTPSGVGSYPLADDIVVATYLHPTRGAFIVSLVLHLRPGERVELLGSDVVLTPEGGEPRHVPIVKTSSGDLPAFDPVQPMLGAAPFKIHAINLSTAPLRAQRLRLRLPPMRVNGRMIESAEQEYVYVEKRGVIDCIQ